MDKTKRKIESSVLKWVLVISIVIVLNLLFNVGIVLFYESPELENFCEQDKQVVEVIESEGKCVGVGGQWIEQGINTTHFERGPTAVPIEKTNNPGYCDRFFTCREEFESEKERYERAVFIILVVLGIISISAGVLIKKYDVVASGLSIGGVLSLVIASIRYWSSAPDIVRFMILAVALAVLIWFGVKKFKD